MPSQVTALLTVPSSPHACPEPKHLQNHTLKILWLGHRMKESRKFNTLPLGSVWTRSFVGAGEELTSSNPIFRMQLNGRWAAPLSLPAPTLEGFHPKAGRTASMQEMQAKKGEVRKRQHHSRAPKEYGDIQQQQHKTQRQIAIRPDLPPGSALKFQPANLTRAGQ